MAKAKKLKSGNWNIRVYDHTDSSGKIHFKSITAPTKSECVYLAAKWRQERPERSKITDLTTVGDAVDKYIDRCEFLSPATVFRYKQMRDSGIFPDLMSMRAADLTRDIVQESINKASRRHTKQTGNKVSPKTIHNEWGLVSAALNEICGISFQVKLPKKQRQPKQYPEPKQVLSVILGSDIELPCLLAMWCSFSMSEIRGLKCSSIRDGCVFIDQVRVCVGGVDVEKKNAKTPTRNRMQVLPLYLLQKIEQLPCYQEYERSGTDSFIVPYSRNILYKRWKKISTAAGIDLSFHDLRHMSASIMLALNIPEKYALERGGWSTPAVMKTVYQHTFSSQRQKADAMVNDYFTELINDN